MLGINHQQLQYSCKSYSTYNLLLATLPESHAPALVNLGICLVASIMQTYAHLAACMTVLSCTLLNAPILMEFRSPRKTHPYQIDVCIPRWPRVIRQYMHMLAVSAPAPCQRGQHPQQERHWVRSTCPEQWPAPMFTQLGVSVSASCKPSGMVPGLTRLPRVINCRCLQKISSSMCTGENTDNEPVVNTLRLAELAIACEVECCVYKVCAASDPAVRDCRAARNRQHSPDMLRGWPLASGVQFTETERSYACAPRESFLMTDQALPHPQRHINERKRISRRTTSRHTCIVAVVGCFSC